MKDFSPNRQNNRPVRNNDRPLRSSGQLIFGIRAVIEAIRSGKEMEALFIQRGAGSGLLHELRDLLQETGTPSQSVPVEKLNRMTSGNHQGVVALVSEITYQKIENIIPMLFEQGKVPFILLLDEITDVRNMGAIARTAECAGVDAIIVPAKGSAQINADTVKTSAGALYKIPVCRVESLHKAVKFLQESGLQIVACTEKTQDEIYEPDYTVPIGIVLGSEEQGISNEIIRSADYLAKIPMFGEIASLNVSVSAGVILYEAIRQRK